MQAIHQHTGSARPATRLPTGPWWQRLGRLRPRGWSTPEAGPVSAVSLNESSVLAVRVEPPAQPGGRPRLTGAVQAPLQDLARLRDKVGCEKCRTVLVLPQEQRQLLAIERPELPDAELALAVRFPLAEAL